MTPSVLILGRSEAAMFLRRERHAPIAGVISIGAFHEPELECGAVARRLELRFDDVDAPQPGDELGAVHAWARQRWAKEVGRPLTPPTLEHARSIIDFAREVARDDAHGVMLCQCAAGISRSPAAALLCLAAWSEEGKEDACVAELLRIRPAAVPLRTLAAFGDTLLGRGGRLVRALAHARTGGGNTSF